jgi:two-component system chemotaxis response regulator CheY
MAQGILLVDDSSTVLNIIKVYLMGLDYELHEAENGERALLLARLVPVSLVIADIRMPKMDGIELTRALRSDANARVRGLPVILLTGEKQGGLEQEALAAGANAFLQKPISRVQLVESITRFLSKPSP